jgi:hypothetical protein
MVVHLSKFAVGCDSISTLTQRQLPWHFTRPDGRLVYRHRTRFLPKRDAELLAGGSLYWIIAHQIIARQAVLGLEMVTIDEKNHVLLHLDPTPVAVQPVPRRAHQGWRYLEEADAPPDISKTAAAGLATLPPALVKILRDLALL